MYEQRFNEFCGGESNLFTEDQTVREAEINDIRGYLSILKQVFDINTIEYRESFKLVLLNRAMKVIGITSIAEGGIECVSVDIRLIFQTALLANASCFIICHNHPSGNLQPSNNDRNLTRTIHEAGKLLNIILVDHIIVTSEGYYSFSDNGIL